MKRRPSAATVWAPAARLKKMGSPPTLRNARTGELTPPGIYLQASSYRLVKSHSSRERCLRQAEPHFEAAAAMIVGARRAPVGLHDLGRDGEADALAAAVAIARFGDAVERLEYTLQVAGRHSRPAIA